MNIQLIPESSAFKPGLPFGLLVVTETPGGEPVEAAVTVETSYLDEDYNEVGQETPDGGDQPGDSGLLRLTPPETAVRMSI